MTQPALFSWTLSYELGARVRDRFTDLEGTVVAVDDDRVTVEYDHPHHGVYRCVYGAPMSLETL